MRPINSKKIIASTVIFFFSNFVNPAMMAATAPPPGSPAGAVSQKRDEKPLVIPPPRVHLSAPRCVIPQITRSKEEMSIPRVDATIWTVPYSLTTLQSLKELPLSMKIDRLVPLHGPYSDVQGGYVNLMPCSLFTGLLEMQQPGSTLEKNLAPLFSHPEKYRVRNATVVAAFFPKIVRDNTTGSSLLIMEPTDFRLIESPRYTKEHLEHMLNVSYAAMKGYATLQEAKKAPVEVHTGFWGGHYKNNIGTTTVIQLIAAELAGIDRLFFHTWNGGHSDTLLTKAVQFLQSYSGLKVSAIVGHLYQNTTNNVSQNSV